MSYAIAESVGELAPPGWWAGPYGAAYHRAIGASHDHLIDRANQAVNCRFPDYAPPDALPNIGKDSLIDRALAVDETDATYRARLQQRWRTWAGADDEWQHFGGAGSPAVMLASLFTEGYKTGASTPHLFTALGPHFFLDNTDTLQFNIANPPWFFGTPFMFNKFQVVFVAPFLGTWTFAGPPAAEISRIRALIKRWKPAHTICAGITFYNGIGGPGGSVAGELWGYPGVKDPIGNPGLWGDAPGVPAGDPAVWGGNSVTVPGVL